MLVWRRHVKGARPTRAPSRDDHFRDVEELADRFADLAGRRVVALVPPFGGAGRGTRVAVVSRGSQQALGRAELPYCSPILSSMPRGNPSPKLTITVDPEVRQQVVAAATDEGVSVSAWLTSAARQALLVRDGLAAVTEWEKRHGRLTDDEMTAARQRVAVQLRSSRRRSA